MSSTNTFTTFLETFKTLERPSGPAWPDVLSIANALLETDGTAPVTLLGGRLELPQDVFLGAVMSGKEKGVFDLVPLDHIREGPRGS